MWVIGSLSRSVDAGFKYLAEYCCVRSSSATMAGNSNDTEAHGVSRWLYIWYGYLIYIVVNCWNGYRLNGVRKTLDETQENNTSIQYMAISHALHFPRKLNSLHIHLIVVVIFRQNVCCYPEWHMWSGGRPSISSTWLLSWCLRFYILCWSAVVSTCPYLGIWFLRRPSRSRRTWQSISKCILI